MKTKTIELYADLMPNWHEAIASQCYVWATSSPGEKMSNTLRVRITVELPEYPRPITADESVNGEASIAARQS